MSCQGCVCSVRVLLCHRPTVHPTRRASRSPSHSCHLSPNLGPLPGPSTARWAGQCEFDQAAASPHPPCIWVPGWGCPARSLAPTARPATFPGVSHPWAAPAPGLLEAWCRMPPRWGPCCAPGSRNQRSSNWIWRLRVEGCDRVAATCEFSTRRLSLPRERAGLDRQVQAAGPGAPRWGARWREAGRCGDPAPARGRELPAKTRQRSALRWVALSQPPGPGLRPLASPALAGVQAGVTKGSRSS